MEHKKRIALELKLSELKEQYEAQAEEFAKAKKKAENMKDVAANYEVRFVVRPTQIIHLHSMQTNAKEQRKLAEDANKKVAKLQKQVEKLKADLEEERARVRPPSPHVCITFYVKFQT